jgi:hypothetical protein
MPRENLPESAWSRSFAIEFAVLGGSNRQRDDQQTIKGGLDHFSSRSTVSSPETKSHRRPIHTGTRVLADLCHRRDVVDVEADLATPLWS